MPRSRSIAAITAAFLVWLGVGLVLVAASPPQLRAMDLLGQLALGAVGLTGLGAVLLAVLARLGGPRAPLLASSTLLFGVVTPALGLRAWLDVRGLEEVLALDSDDISVAAPELGEGGHRLIANLRDAQVVVATRPIDITEIDGFHLDQTVTRRKAFLVNTNSLGMRGSRELVTPAERFRVVFVGSSITFGHGVDDDETMVALLEERLGVETVNAGVPGRRAGAAARWMAELAPVLDPDLIVLSESPPGEATVDDLSALAATYPDVPLAVVLPPTPRSHLRIEDLAHSDLRNPSAQLLQSRLPDLPVLDLSMSLLERMEPPGAYLLVDRQGQALIDLATGEVLASSESTSFLVAGEITAALEADHSLRFPFFVDDAHPDEQGHRLMAQLVGDWLLEQGLVPGPEGAPQGEQAPPQEPPF